MVMPNGQAGPEISTMSVPAFGPPRKYHLRGLAGSVAAILVMEIHVPLRRSMNDNQSGIAKLDGEFNSVRVKSQKKASAALVLSNKVFFL
jgi:hypothetical protein